MRYSTKHLDILGKNQTAIRHSFFHQNGETRSLAVVLPGRGYTSQGPILFYPINILLSLGYDVFSHDEVYGDSFFLQDEPSWVEAYWDDISASVTQVLRQRPYTNLLLIGKSLGSLGLSLIEAHQEALSLPEIQKWAWLTPLIGRDAVFKSMERLQKPAFYAVGTADTFCYLPDRYRVLDQKLWRGLVFEGADHSLDHESDVLRSIEDLRKYVQAFRAFLDYTTTM